MDEKYTISRVRAEYNFENLHYYLTLFYLFYAENY